MYTSEEDKQWLQQQDDYDVHHRFIKGATETIVDGVTAIKTGGHFDGSLVLHWEDKLFIADSMITVPVWQFSEYSKRKLMPRTVRFVPH